MTQETKQCQNCHHEFQIEQEDFAFYEKMSVPAPTFCPECRHQRRLTYRNERSLYKRKCDLCQKDIISMYPENLNVYCSSCFFSDKWDALDYGQDYNFKEVFFKQWHNLLYKIPLIELNKIRANVNSNFVNYAADNNNCYLSYSIVGCENVLYSYGVDKNKDCLDSAYLKNSELCYENFNSENNFRGIFLIKSRNCLNSAFLFDCVNCQDCFLSTNLRNKKYVFENKQYTKEEYIKKISDLNIGSFEVVNSIKERFYRLFSSGALHRYANIIKSTNAIGENIKDSKNVKYSFDVYGAEDIKYSVRVLPGSKDVHDGYGIKAELFYDGLASGFGGYLMRFCFLNDNVRDIFYSLNCYNSSSLFGCIGLRNKQYCIFNKQYTKEQYEELIPKIIEHMDSMPYTDKKGNIYKYGEFFPIELSPFAYNETIAQEYFPLSAEATIDAGYKWKDAEERNIQPEINYKDLPDSIKDVKDDIIGKTILCKFWDEDSKEAQGHNCTKVFKIIPQELEFYKKMNLPLPRLCPNCRHYQRIKQRNPLKLWHRKCMCAGEKSDNQIYQNTTSHLHKKEHCPNEFETTYSPNRKEIVYCEKCYQEEVV